MYYSAIGAIALLVLLIDNRDIIFEFNAGQMKPVWKTYRRFLFAILAYCISDIFWGIIESLKTCIGPWANSYMLRKSRMRSRKKQII